MNALEKNRLIINEADDELVKLFEKRMHAVKEILAYKKENGLPVLDASREADNIARNCAKVQDEELKKHTGSRTNMSTMSFGRYLKNLPGMLCKRTSYGVVYLVKRTK